MDSKEIEQSVYKYFKSGYHCAEVITRTIFDGTSQSSYEQVLRAASGFGGGIAGTMTELCGAFTGGVMAVSALYGREYPDEDLSGCGKLIIAYKQYFKDEFGSLRCPAIIEKMEPDDFPIGCARLTAKATIVLMEMVHELEVIMAGSACSGNGPLEAGAGVLKCPFGSQPDSMPV